jgi:cation:H+ antiporter
MVLVICAVVIYLSCEWFVNGVEWLGDRLRVGSLAVGTVLAAFGTALPESVVTFVAVALRRGDVGDQVGMGAALGGPLVLSTIAYGVAGGALLVHRRRAGAAAGAVADAGAGADVGVGAVADAGAGAGAGAVADADAGVGVGADVVHGPVLTLRQSRRLAGDQTAFIVIFVAKVTLGLVAFAYKPWLGLLFFAAYGGYVWREMRGDPDDVEAGELEALKLRPRHKVPGLPAIVTQTVLALAVVFVAAEIFVGQLEAVGPMLGLSPAVTAVLLSPVATELPETMNAVIWIRQGKTRLALGNISGSMMIQATVPSGLGLLFTPWLFDAPLVLAAAVTLLAISYLLVLLRSGRLTPLLLTCAAAWYALFAALLVAIA